MPFLSEVSSEDVWVQSTMNTNETIDVCTSSFSKKHEFRLHTHQNHIVGFVSLLKKPSLRLEVTYAATYLEDLNSTLQLPYIFAANPPLNFQQLFRHGGWSDCRSSRRVLVSSSSCRLVTPIPPNGGLGVPKKPWFRFRNYSDFM